MKMKTAAIQLGIRDGESVCDRKTRVEEEFVRMEREKRVPDLIMLPELWQCGFFHFEKYRDHGQEENGEMTVWLRSWAKRLGCMIHTGSFVERSTKPVISGSEKNGCSEKEEKLFNTSLLIGRDGKILAKYRKVHLFGYESEEKRILRPGTRITEVETEFGKIGLATCYDLRFPEQFRRMTELGAEIFLITSAWPLQRLEHWKLFNQVRALENQSFLFSCNCGYEREGSCFAGHSMCVSPDGTVLAEAGETPEVLYAEIDTDQTEAYRKAFPSLADRVTLQ
ncbi:MAG: carbon-nitrogen family hydrolase [Candidatus Choladocola sp.]|nr:carbon-nitrogen family hydrolase [Candidatus Choladocola sp.]